MTETTPVAALDAALLEEILALFPPTTRTPLLALLLDEGATEEQVEAALVEAVGQVDWQAQEATIRSIMGRLLPLESLVPEVYAAWRPVVRDAVAFVAARLSPERTVPKLVEQLRLAEAIPLEERLIVLVSRVPALQKLGQVVARLPALDPSVRAQLTRLENGISDIAPAVTLEQVRQELGPRLAEYGVTLHEVVVAEASVSVVVRFTWNNPETGEAEAGVFKVLKPYVATYLPEELVVLAALAAYFEEHHARYNLPPLALSEVLAEVRILLLREVDLPNEQAMLVAAAARYADMPDIRIPRLIPQLSTPTITAMTEEQGVKVTEAYRQRPDQRARLAALLWEALVARPLYDSAEDAPYHADTHAGNLLVNEQTGEVILLDWAMVETLSRAQRRQIVRLAVAILWREPRYVFEAVAALANDDLSVPTSIKATLVRGEIARFFNELPPSRVPGFEDVVRLLDGLGTSGTSFPPELLMLRKMLFTLVQVLHEIAPTLPLDLVLFRHALQLLAEELPDRLRRPPMDNQHSYRLHLSNYDVSVLFATFPLLLNRLWLQALEQSAAATLRAWQRAGWPAPTAPQPEPSSLPPTRLWTPPVGELPASRPVGQPTTPAWWPSFLPKLEIEWSALETRTFPLPALFTPPAPIEEVVEAAPVLPAVPIEEITEAVPVLPAAHDEPLRPERLPVDEPALARALDEAPAPDAPTVFLAPNDVPAPPDLATRIGRPVPAEIAQYLAAEGALTDEEILIRFRTPSQRQSSARALGVEEKVILELANRVDLMRVEGITPPLADLVAEAGISTVKELARRRAASVQNKVLELNRVKQTVELPPSLEEIQGWIDQAKALPRMLEY